MREILFKGKRADNGEWVEGCYCKYPHQFSSFLKDYIFTSWYDAKLVSSVESGTCIAYPVDPETVGQYTGLTDKNGTKIFEGDIVTGYFNYEKIIGYIFYGGNAQFFIQRDGILGIGLDNADCWLEVVGNIYDNPELLGEPMKPASKNVAQSGLAPATENFELLEG